VKTIVITGATSGIGFEIAKTCLKNGYHVIGIGRNKEKNEETLKKLSNINQDVNVDYFLADLLEIDEINSVSKQISELIENRYDRKLFGLINNVGCIRSWYQTNSYGYEHQFALNHLSSVLLTNNLLRYLINDSGRIIFTSSESHKNMKMHWNDIMYEKRYRPLMAYKQSKLSNLLFVYKLNDMFMSKGIRAYGIDPGLVNTNIGLKNTSGLVSFVWKLRKKKGVGPEVPAKTYLWLLNQTKHPKSLYYHDSASKGFSREVNIKNADRLLKLSEKLLHIKVGDTL